MRFVTDNSGISSKDFRRLMMNTGELVMDVGTVLDGEKAVQAGLIDHLGGLSEAISCLYRMIEKKEKGAKSAVRPQKRRAQTMILHSVTPIWAMQQMMAEQSEQPTTVLLSETAALQGRIQNGQLLVERILSTDPHDFLRQELSPGKQVKLPAKKQIFLDYFL